MFVFLFVIRCALLCGVRLVSCYVCSVVCACLRLWFKCVCLCVIDCVMLYGMFLCVLVLSVVRNARVCLVCAVLCMCCCCVRLFVLCLNVTVVFDGLLLLCVCCVCLGVPCLLHVCV